MCIRDRSNIANVLLILGVAALIRPVTCLPEAFYRDASALGLATALGTLFIYFGHVGRVQGLLLVLGSSFWSFFANGRGPARLPRFWWVKRKSLRRRRTRSFER